MEPLDLKYFNKEFSIVSIHPTCLINPPKHMAHITSANLQHIQDRPDSVIYQAFHALQHFKP